MVMVSPIAAPSIIRPMIDVPQTRLPSFSTSTVASSWLASDELGAGPGVEAARFSIGPRG
jgi:hypothetical protein